MKCWILLAALLGASGVALGAYQAHGLESLLDEQGIEENAKIKRLQNCEVAVRYQMLHALALLVVSALAMRTRSRLMDVAASLWLVGVLLFSGMLYAYAFAGFMIGPVVPLGGLAMICGWVVLGIVALRLPLPSPTSDA